MPNELGQLTGATTQIKPTFTMTARCYHGSAGHQDWPINLARLASKGGITTPRSVIIAVM